MIDLNRKYKFNEEVYIFADFENGLPRIEKGRICGIGESNGIYKFRYLIEAHGTDYYRFPDAIFKSIEEMKEELINFVVE